MTDMLVYLRPMQDDDVTERYVAWFADPLVTRFLDARNITRQDALDYLAQGRRSGLWHQYAVCRRSDALHVGSVKIGPIKHDHALSDLVTVIGERSAWGYGVATQAIRQAIDLAFGSHGIRKLSASIDSLNVGSIKAYTRAGFSIEARLPAQFLHRDEAGRLIVSDKIYVGRINENFGSADA